MTEEAVERPAGLDLLWQQLRQRVEERGPGVEVGARVRAERVEMLLRVCAAQLVGPAEREPEPDGSGWMLLRLRFVAEGVALAALLGFGASVEILSPESLRRSFAVTAREVLALCDS
jgi:predicted DNA-binding transcriptional regulator YafY